MAEKKGSIKLWEDERANPDKRWTLTIRQGSIVENLRFPSRAKALTYARGLRSSKKVAAR